MNHKVALLLGIVMVFTGVLVIAYWGTFIIGGFGEGNAPIDFASIFGVLLIFGGFTVLYYFVFRKWELEHGSGNLSY